MGLEPVSWARWRHPIRCFMPGGARGIHMRGPHTGLACPFGLPGILPALGETYFILSKVFGKGVQATREPGGWGQVAMETSQRLRCEEALLGQALPLQLLGPASLRGRTGGGGRCWDRPWSLHKQEGDRASPGRIPGEKWL